MDGKEDLTPPLALRVEQAAEALQCSRSTIYSLLGRGELRGVRLGRGRGAGVRVLADSLDEFVSAGGPAVRPNPAASWRGQARRRLYGDD